MPLKFFGQFLLERGKILREELLDALEFQQQTNLKLGNIALETGYLTKEQVENIHQDQQRTDKMFGEIAVNLKYLNSKQVEELLQIQKNARITLGEALVQKGYLSLATLEQELAEFKKLQEGVVEKVYLAVRKSPTPVIPEIFLDLTIKLFRRMVDVDLEVTDSHRDVTKIAPYLWNIYQRFSGDCSGLCVVSLTETIFLKTASHIAQEKIWEIDDLAKDGVREFVNIVVGNSAAKLSHDHGIQISLHPPKFFTSLGTIEIPADISETVALKLGCPEYELQDYNVQIAVLYSPPAKIRS